MSKDERRLEGKFHLIGGGHNHHGGKISSFSKSIPLFIIHLRNIYDLDFLYM